MDITVYYTETLEKTLSLTDEDVLEHVAANPKDYTGDPLPERAEDEDEGDFADRFCDWVSENLPVEVFDRQADIESEEIEVTEVTHS